MTEGKGNTTWIGDGSEGSKLSSSATDNSCTIAFASATQGTPFNVRLDEEDDTPIADSYYQVEVLDISRGSYLGIGLVTREGFQPGWKTRGCFYNGNITNGSAGLIIGFGKTAKPGDVVGVYQQLKESETGQRINVIFYHNGRCMGAGFSLENMNEKFFPCLHLSGSAEVKYSVPAPPAVFEREQETLNQDDSYSGDWAIVQAFTGPELTALQLPEDSTFKVSLEKKDAASSTDGGAQEYALSVKVDNSMHTSFTIVGKMEAFDKIELAGRCAATRKMPRPAFQEMEEFVTSALSGDGGFRKMIISDDQLVMTGPTAEMICSRFIESFEPVTSIK